MLIVVIAKSLPRFIPFHLRRVAKAGVSRNITLLSFIRGTWMIPLLLVFMPIYTLRLSISHVFLIMWHLNDIVMTLMIPIMRDVIDLVAIPRRSLFHYLGVILYFIPRRLVTVMDIQPMISFLFVAAAAALTTGLFNSVVIKLWMINLTVVEPRVLWLTRSKLLIKTTILTAVELRVFTLSHTRLAQLRLLIKTTILTAVKP
ncbi:hypothetical protein QBC43DRAFT_326917 [Cladorrhinum sp. PSN259]|nr:hypothetical protein QBC43DRAFT_326917 [Cladorrhinum sp. PSN259]